MIKLKLKELREQEKLTQLEIAKRLNASQQNYARWELNKNQPSIGMLIKIADYYGVSLDYLCDHKTQNKLNVGYLTAEQKTAIQLLLKLNTANLYQLIGYLTSQIQHQQ